MRALPTGRRAVVLAALTALLGMHGVSAGHEAMASMPTMPTVPLMSTMSIGADVALLPEAHPAEVPSGPAGLMATTCLALLGLGVVLLVPRTGRQRGLTQLASPQVPGRTRVSHWPRGPDPVAELCLSRT